MNYSSDDDFEISRDFSYLDPNYEWIFRLIEFWDFLKWFFLFSCSLDKSVSKVWKNFEIFSLIFPSFSKIVIYRICDK